jgi:hypothetical protein
VTGPTGLSGRETAEGYLAPKALETGTWSAVINAGVGMHQEQALANISYPIPLSRFTQTKPTAIYRNEQQAKEPTFPCEGSVEKPMAAEGALCVFRGAANFGSNEKEDQNAAFYEFLTPAGENVVGGGRVGTMIAFRTTEFEEGVATGTPPVTLNHNAYLSAGGSWALRSK